jgi:hypothetical protein
MVHYGLELELFHLHPTFYTRAYRRNRQGPSGGEFGDDLGSGRKHVHQWGRSIESLNTKFARGLIQ